MNTSRRYHPSIGSRTRGACLLALVGMVMGCRPPAPAAPVTATSQPSHLVGVYSLGPAPSAGLAGPVGVGAQALKGTAKGGGIGLFAGAGGGALTGAALGLACGPLAVVCSPVFAVWGAAIGGAGGLVTGGTIGAINRGGRAIPRGTADVASATIAAAMRDRDLQAALRARIVANAVGHVGERVDLGAADGDTTPAVAYARFAQQGAQAVLEVALDQVGLAATSGGRDPELALVMAARGRLVSVPDRRPLSNEEVVAFESPSVPLSQWTAADGRQLRAELDHGADVLALALDARVFPTTMASGRRPAVGLVVMEPAENG